MGFQPQGFRDNDINQQVDISAIEPVIWQHVKHKHAIEPNKLGWEEVHRTKDAYLLTFLPAFKHKWVQNIFAGTALCFLPVLHYALHLAYERHVQQM